MKKNQRKSKGVLRKIISVALSAAVVLGLGVAVVKLSEAKTREVSSLAFEVGGLSTDESNLGENLGKHVERKDAIYTKEAIECKGLTVTPDFDAKLQYQIFWYNVNDECFGYTALSSEKFIGNVPEFAKYCRIMILPTNLEGEDIKFWEVSKYAKYLTIEVNKKQVFAPIDYYEEASTKYYAGEGYQSKGISEKVSFYISKQYVYETLTSKFEDQLTDTDDKSVFVKIDCSNAKAYIVYFNEKYNDGNKTIDVMFFAEDGTIIGSSEADRCFTTVKGTPGGYFEFLVPSGAKYLGVNVPDAEKPVVINQYK